MKIGSAELEEVGRRKKVTLERREDWSRGGKVGGKGRWEEREQDGMRRRKMQAEGEGEEGGGRMRWTVK